MRVLYTDDAKGALVYDLRIDPDEFKDLSPEQLVERWQYTKDPDAPARLPVKTLKYNHCPALSPTGILSDESVQKRLGLTPKIVSTHLAKLTASPELIANIVKARDLLDDERGEQWSKRVSDPDAALYDGFVDDNDKRLMAVVRAAEPTEISEIRADMHDHRLQELLPRYKARNFSSSLTDEERAEWEKYRYHALMDGGAESRLARFMHRLGQLAQSEQSQEERYLLEELQLYAESIMPITDNED